MKQEARGGLPLDGEKLVRGGGALPMVEMESISVIICPFVFCCYSSEYDPDSLTERDVNCLL